MKKHKNSKYKKKIKIAHIVPSMNYGGVEVAISKSLPYLKKKFDYKIYTVKNKGILQSEQKNFIHLFKDIIRKKWFPDLIITSLWWSHLIGIILKLIGFKWATFYHSSKSNHIINYLITLLSINIADIILADSNATKKYLKKFTKKNIEIIPFVFLSKKEKLVSLNKRKFDFIFVGRVSKEKRIDLLLRLTKELYKKSPEKKFCFIFSGKNRVDYIKKNNVHIEIKYNLQNNKVLSYMKHSKFYIHLADREGMSMTTIESIQSGCIPIVRPVGEIKNYIKKDSSIIINKINQNSLIQIANKIHKISLNIKKLTKMQQIGMKRIKYLPEYSKTLEQTIKCKLNM